MNLVTTELSKCFMQLLSASVDLHVQISQKMPPSMSSTDFTLKAGERGGEGVQKALPA